MVRALMAALLTMTALLAGCADDGAGGPTPPPVAADKGAIQGVLYDDRYRPIHLVEDEKSEFQAEGFLLLQETGEEVRTTENGEFTFPSLAPGQYTIRGTATGHEIRPRLAQVVAGEFTEVDIEARRIATGDELIITEEYSLFIPCSAYAIFDCTGDQSGDSWRSGLNFQNMSIYGDVTYSVWEVILNQPGIYCLEVRDDPFDNANPDEPHYGNWCSPENGKYIKGVLQAGEIYNDASRTAWDPNAPIQEPLFYFGNNEALCWDPYTGPITGNDAKRCPGVALGIRGQVMLSIFVGETTVDMDTYCILCE